jgi:hypothetical protein
MPVFNSGKADDRAARIARLDPGTRLQTATATSR